MNKDTVTWLQKNHNRVYPNFVVSWQLLKLFIQADMVGVARYLLCVPDDKKTPEMLEGLKVHTNLARESERELAERLGALYTPGGRRECTLKVPGNLAVNLDTINSPVLYKGRVDWLGKNVLVDYKSGKRADKMQLEWYLWLAIHDKAVCYKPRKGIYSAAFVYTTLKRTTLHLYRLDDLARIDGAKDHIVQTLQSMIVNGFLDDFVRHYGLAQL